MKTLRLIALAALALGLAVQTADAQSQKRSNTWEVYGGLRPIFGESVDFDGGSTIDTDDDLGLAFGFGYNFDEHLLVGGELSWSSIDYKGQLRSADVPDDTTAIDGEFDVATMSGSVTYHFIDGPLTPFVSGTLGYTWIDTNIATGPPVTGCWWDPWFGYICDTFVDTKSEDAFAYGAGLGVRWDFGNGLFGRLSYDERWINIDNADGTPSFGTMHIDFGGKF